MKREGKVYLVGAGSGDPGLLTLRAKELLETADVVLYDYLVQPRLLDGCPADCEKIYVGKRPRAHAVPQAEIERILVSKAREGRSIVRLKGGDPFVYGRGGEEAATLAENDIAFEVVPGVTAGVAAAAYAGLPLTLRNTSSSVVFLTGHEDPEKKRLSVRWREFATLDATLCIYMGVGHLGEITGELIAGGMKPETPAAIVQWASLPRQRSLYSTVETIADEVVRTGLKSPAIVIVGEAARRKESLAWFENRPLFGKRIVVTRNQAQAGRLREKLERLGAEVLELPLVEVTADPHPEIADEVFGEFWSYEWIVFTSANGVRYFFKEFFRRYPDIRALGAIRFAAIGKATAAAIEANRVAVDLVADKATAEGLAESLIETGSIQSAQILVVTGNRNRRVLIDALDNAGGIVDELPVYKTQLVDLGDHAEATDFRKNGADLMIFTSSSAVGSFVRQLTALKLEPNAVSPATASLGPLTSAKLASHGIPVSLEAKEQTLDALVETIVAYFAADRKGDGNG